MNKTMHHHCQLFSFQLLFLIFLMDLGRVLAAGQVESPMSADTGKPGFFPRLFPQSYPFRRRGLERGVSRTTAW